MIILSMTTLFWWLSYLWQHYSDDYLISDNTTIQLIFLSVTALLFNWFSYQWQHCYDDSLLSDTNTILITINSDSSTNDNTTILVAVNSDLSVAKLFFTTSLVSVNSDFLTSDSTPDSCQQWFSRIDSTTIHCMKHCVLPVVQEICLALPSQTQTWLTLLLFTNIYEKNIYRFSGQRRWYCPRLSLCVPGTTAPALVRNRSHHQQ